MLKLTIPSREYFNETTSEFITPPDLHAEFEHSLYSISLWESRWEKPFLSSDKNPIEMHDYIRCMCITDTFEQYPDLYLDPERMQRINDYINAKMTATWFNDKNQSRGRGEVITSEIIYYWMVTFRIPFECQHWHINRLLTLIRVCSEKQKKPRKMTRKEAMAQQRALNAQRRAKYNTKG